MSEGANMKNRYAQFADDMMQVFSNLQSHQRNMEHIEELADGGADELTVIRLKKEEVARFENECGEVEIRQ